MDTAQVVVPQSDQATTPPIPEAIGRYLIREAIGEGGFGIVYAALQSEPVKRRVALKVIKPGMDSASVIARFETERQALAVMDHPGVAKVFDGGTVPEGQPGAGRPFFVMEYVPGIPITEFCDKNQLTIEERISLFTDVCDAVQHAHTKAVIHRDLKPNNILASFTDGIPTVKVIDFGVAKALNQRLSEHTVYTERGQLIGTPQYMSPEQAEMSGIDIDTRSDIYSLGVVLYELLTGCKPFELDQAAILEMQRAIRDMEPTKPSAKLGSMLSSPDTQKTVSQLAKARSSAPHQITKMLRQDLDWVVMRCLEKQRTRRYDSASSLAQDLRRYIAGEPVLASPPSASYQVRKFIRRNKGLVLTAGVILLTLVLGITGTSAGLSWALKEKQRADSEAEEATLARQSESEQRHTALRNADEARVQRDAAELSKQRSDMARSQMLGRVGDFGPAISQLLEISDSVPDFEWRWTAWGILRQAGLTRYMPAELAYASPEMAEPMRTTGNDAVFNSKGNAFQSLRYNDNFTRRLDSVYSFDSREPVPIDQASQMNWQIVTRGSDTHSVRNPDSSKLLDMKGSGRRVNQIRILDTDTDRASGTVHLPDSEIFFYDVWFDEANSYAALGDSSGQIHTVAFRDQDASIIRTISGIGQRYGAVWMDGQRRVVRTVNGDWSLAEFDLLPHADIRQIDRWIPNGMLATSRRLAIHPSMPMLFVGSYSGWVSALDSESHEIIWRQQITPPEKLRNDGYRYGELAVSPDGTKLLVSGNDNAIKLLDTMTGEILQTIPVLDGICPRASFMSNNSILYRIRQNEIAFAKLNSLEPILVYSGSEGSLIYAIKVSPQYDSFAFIVDNSSTSQIPGEVVAFSMASGTPQQMWSKILSSGGRSLVYAPDGKSIATSERGGIANLWDADDGALLQELSVFGGQGHRNIVSGIDHHPTQPIITTASHDGFIRFWSTVSSQLLAEVILDHNGDYGVGRLKSILFNTAGSELIIAFEDGIRRLDLRRYDDSIRAIKQLRQLRQDTD